MKCVFFSLKPLPLSYLHFIFFLFFSFVKDLRIYFEKESDHGWESQKEGQRENLKQTPCWAWIWTSSWDHDLNQNQVSDAQTTEPPKHLHFLSPNKLPDGVMPQKYPIPFLRDHVRKHGQLLRDHVRKHWTPVTGVMGSLLVWRSILKKWGSPNIFQPQGRISQFPVVSLGTNINAHGSSTFKFLSYSPCNLRLSKEKKIHCSLENLKSWHQ